MHCGCTKIVKLLFIKQKFGADRESAEEEKYQPNITAKFESVREYATAEAKTFASSISVAVLKSSDTVILLAKIIAVSN